MPPRCLHKTNLTDAIIGDERVKQHAVVEKPAKTALQKRMGSLPG